MKTRYLYGSLAGVLLVSATAYGISMAGQPSRSLMSPVDYHEAMRVIEARAHVAYALCDAGAGPAEDLCRIEARADESTGKADLEAGYRGTVAAAGLARLAHAEAQYLVADAKCGAARERTFCLGSARAEKARAMAEAKFASR